MILRYLLHWKSSLWLGKRAFNGSRWIMQTCETGSHRHVTQSHRQSAICLERNCCDRWEEVRCVSLPRSSVAKSFKHWSCLPSQQVIANIDSHLQWLITAWNVSTSSGAKIRNICLIVRQYVGRCQVVDFLLRKSVHDIRELKYVWVRCTGNLLTGRIELKL